uniref:Synaptotagmin VIIa n=1 Tax=Paramormyrops kingsleyae TaxID=1676925 RepID=A0A3B3TFX6_9TELE
MYLNREEENGKGSVSLSVFLVSLAFTVCAVWLVALCGVCGWCQRKLESRGHWEWDRSRALPGQRGRGTSPGWRLQERQTQLVAGGRKKPSTQGTKGRWQEVGRASFQHPINVLLESHRRNLDQTATTDSML